MKFQIVNLQQGSPEWLAFRRAKCTASEAPMMLGLHANVKRTELLRMKKLGTEQEFSDFVQRNILDKGHEVEEQARTLLEQRIGEDLYPATGYVGNLSASLDGMTLDGRLIFEHKQYNANLADAVDRGELPEQYMAQVQQQLMLSEALACVFVCSDGTAENWHEISIAPDKDWFDRLINSWTQFLLDLETYEPEPVKVEAVASAIDSLPGVSLVVSANVEKSNLPVFANAARQFLANINTDLQTDQDFADAEATVKFLKKTEEQLEAAKSAALSQTADLDQALRTLDDMGEQMRAMRLKLDKLVKTEKENRKTALIQAAILNWQNAIKSVNAGLDLGVRLQIEKPDFAGSVKGKKSLSSMADALDTLVANAKTEANMEAERIRANIDHYKQQATGYEFLFNDLQTIIHHPLDALDGLISSRVIAHKQAEQARLDAERERIRLEEQRKLEAEQNRANASQAPNPQAQNNNPQAPAKPPQETVTHNPRLVVGQVRQGELEAWYNRIKADGQIPLSDRDADIWIWPLILKAYEMGQIGR
ncbi:MAG: YqaJ viral recombinase family protein [Thiomicrospira sp.]